jgi:hypothetical protein
MNALLPHLAMMRATVSSANKIYYAKACTKQVNCIIKNKTQLVKLILTCVTRGHFDTVNKYYSSRFNP